MVGWCCLPEVHLRAVCVNVRGFERRSGRDATEGLFTTWYLERLEKREFRPVLNRIIDGILGGLYLYHGLGPDYTTGVGPNNHNLLKD